MARIAIGLDAEDGKKKVVKLDAWRKNTHPRKFKKPGRKRSFHGTLNHSEVNPAPDTIRNKSLNETGLNTNQSDCDPAYHIQPQKTKRQNCLKHLFYLEDSRFNPKEEFTFQC